MHLCRTLTASRQISLVVPDHDGDHDGDQAPPDHVPDAPGPGLCVTAQAAWPRPWLLTESHLVTAGGLGAQLRLRLLTQHNNTQHSDFTFENTVTF